MSIQRFLGAAALTLVIVAASAAARDGTQTPQASSAQAGEIQSDPVTPAPDSGG